MSFLKITVKGLVIASRDVNENDRYITVVTEELGVLNFLAKGARKNTSKSNSSVQLFAYSDFCLNENRGRYFLESAKPLNVFYGIRSGVDKLALAAYIAELTKYSVMFMQPEKEIMRLLLNTFYYLSEGSFSCSQLKAVFELRFACCSGYMPMLLGCRECLKYEDSEMLFVYDGGCLLCREHTDQTYLEGDDPQAIAITPSVLHVVRTVCLSELKQVFGFKVSGKTLDTVGRLSEKYLLTQLNCRFDTLDFYDQVKDI